MIFKEMKNGHLAQRVSQVLPIVFLLSCSHGGFPDHRHGSRACAEVQTMMTAAAGLRRVALERSRGSGRFPWSDSISNLLNHRSRSNTACG